MEPGGSADPRGSADPSMAWHGSGCKGRSGCSVSRAGRGEAGQHGPAGTPAQSMAGKREPTSEGVVVVADLELRLVVPSHVCYRDAGVEGLGQPSPSVPAPAPSGDGVCGWADKRDEKPACPAERSAARPVRASPEHRSSPTFGLWTTRSSRCHRCSGYLRAKGTNWYHVWQGMGALPPQSVEACMPSCHNLQSAGHLSTRHEGPTDRTNCTQALTSIAEIAHVPNDVRIVGCQVL